MDLRRIDLNLLVLFEAIYSAGNVGKAAARLGLSQPAASNGLARLRKQLGDPLFKRSADGVEPTAAARAAIERVREALGLLTAGLDGGQIDLVTYQRQFRLVMVDALEPVIMPPIVRLIAERAPGVSIELVGAQDLAFLEEIRTGTIDLAVYAFPLDAPDIRTVSLGPINMVAIARRDHPGIDGNLDVEKLGQLPHLALRRQVRAQTHVPKDFVAHGVGRRIVCSASKTWSLPWMVEHTDLIAFVTRRFAGAMSQCHALDIHELPIPLAEQYLYLLWHERSDADPGHRWLREALVEAAAAGQEQETPLKPGVKPPQRPRVVAKAAKPRRPSSARRAAPAKRRRGRAGSR
jgi:DNA-binding transcriptional LysR family regulator